MGRSKSAHDEGSSEVMWAIGYDWDREQRVNAKL
jgi:hypothetical protein